MPEPLAEDKLLRLVRTAVDCFEKGTPDANLSGWENIQRYDVVSDLIVDSLGISPSDLRLSSDAVGYELRVFLNSLKNEKDIGEAYKDAYPGFLRKLSAKPLVRYQIGFPLNIRFSFFYEPRTYRLGDLVFRELDFQRWQDKYHEKAAGQDTYQNVMEQHINEYRRDFSYWETTVESRDLLFATQHVGSTVEVLLGQLNFAIHTLNPRGWHFRVGVSPPRWSDIRLPFIYIVLKGGTFALVAYEEDTTIRHSEDLSGKKDRLDKIFMKLPKKQTRSIDDSLFAGLRWYQRGMTEPNLRDAYLAFWQGLETLTFLEKEERGGRRVVQRALSTIRLDEREEILERRVDRATQKRNILVHSGFDSPVSERDVEFLKLLLDGLILFIWRNRTTMKKSDFIYWFDQGWKKPPELKAISTEKRRQLGLLKKILEYHERQEQRQRQRKAN